MDNLTNRLHDDDSRFDYLLDLLNVSKFFEFRVETTLLLAEAVKTKVLCLCLRKIRSGL